MKEVLGARPGGGVLHSHAWTVMVEGHAPLGLLIGASTHGLSFQLLTAWQLGIESEFLQKGPLENKHSKRTRWKLCLLSNLRSSYIL